MLRRLLRWVAYGFATLCLLFLLTVFLLWWFFPTDRLRQYVVDTLEARLDRSVHIERLNLHLWGIAVSDVRIADREPDQHDLMRIDRLRVRISLRDLLSKRLVIKQIILSHPHLVLVERQGVWNLQTFWSELTAGPSPSDSTSKPDTSTSPLPFGLQLEEVRLQEIEIEIYRDTGLKLLLSGLSLRISGEISERANHLLARIEAHPKVANFNLATQTPEPLQIQGGLELDLRLSQQLFRTINLSGTVRLNASQVDFRSASFPFTIQANTELSADIRDQTVRLNRLHLRLADDTTLRIRGHVSQVNANPIVDLQMTGAHINLNEFEPLISQILPEMKLGGTLSLPRLTFTGPDQDNLLRVNGAVVLNDAALDAPSLGIRVTEVNANLSDLQCVLKDLKLSEITGVAHAEYQQVALAGLRLMHGDHTLKFSLSGADLKQGRIRLNFNNKEVYYDHPRWGSIRTALSGTLSVEGDYIQGNVSNLQLKATSGSWLDTELTGSMEQFGKKQLALKHSMTLNLDAIDRVLPQAMLSQLGAFDVSGRLTVKNKIAGKITAADRGLLRVRSDVAIDQGQFRHPSFGNLESVQGGITLQTAYALSGHVEELKIDGNLKVQEVRAPNHVVLSKNEIAFHLRLPQAQAANELFLQPITKVQLSSRKVQAADWNVTLDDFSGSLNLHTPLKLKRLTLNAIGQVPQLIVKPAVQGTLQWAKASLEHVTTGQTRVSLKATAESLGIDRIQTEVEMKVAELQLGLPSNSVPGTSFDLKLRSAQDLRLGNIRLQQFSLRAPKLIQLTAQGETTTWGKSFNIKLQIPALHLDPLFQRLPVNYRQLVPLQGVAGLVQIEFIGQGVLPNIGSLKALNLPQFDADMTLRNLSLTPKTDAYRFHGGHGSLHLSGAGNSVSIRGDLGLDRLVFTGIPSQYHPSIRLQLDYALQDGRMININKHELRFPEQGIVFTLRGNLGPLPDVLARPEALGLPHLLRTMDAHVIIKHALSTPIDIRHLVPTFEYEGSLQNELVMTLRGNDSLNLNGRLQIDNFSATSSPFLRVKKMQGTIRYQKKLTLQQTSNPSPNATEQPAQPKQTLPPALRGRLRAFSPHRDSIVIDQLVIGPLIFSALAFDVALTHQLMEIQHFEAELLDGAIAGSVQVGELGHRNNVLGIHLSSEFAQLNLATLLPNRVGIPVDEGAINGNVDVKLTFPVDPDTPVGVNALTVTLNITHIGKQALDHLLLFLDPLEKDPTIANQRRLLRLATPRLLTLRLQNGILNVSTELDTPLGRKRQPVSPIPISALEGAGIPHVQTLLDRIEQLRLALKPIVAQSLKIGPNGRLVIE